MGRFMWIAAVGFAMSVAGCSDEQAQGVGARDGASQIDGAVDAAVDGEALASVDGTVPPEPLRSFYSDLEGVVPPQVNIGDCKLKPTQGFATLGSPTNRFATTFLWCPLQKKVVVTLSPLAPHTSIDIKFLLAAIDSLDGTSPDGGGDILLVTLDGNPIFEQSFANTGFIEAATGHITYALQSYVPAPGVELARRVDLGFSKGPYWLDSAYDMALEPAFSGIPHSSPTATVVFALTNDKIMAFDDDESWAIDNLRITVGDGPRNPADAGLDAAGDAR
ncbi:MAG: hypothetical protein SF187_17780 [Deltaproteobacteria bacterium]|nr:hypothetical protein [Deltaproteobacteria bacterium]